jgi:hypothetical protein
VRARRVIRGIAVDQHVDVGLDIGEHPPHHAALALVLLAADDSAGGGCRFDGTVGRIVVVDVDAGLWQRRAEIDHDLADGGFLVVARHQHRNPAAAHDFGSARSRLRRQLSWQHLGPSPAAASSRRATSHFRYAHLPAYHSVSILLRTI